MDESEEKPWVEPFAALERALEKESARAIRAALPLAERTVRAWPDARSLGARAVWAGRLRAWAREHAEGRPLDRLLAGTLHEELLVLDAAGGRAARVRAHDVTTLGQLRRGLAAALDWTAGKHLAGWPAADDPAWPPLGPLSWIRDLPFLDGLRVVRVVPHGVDAPAEEGGAVTLLEELTREEAGAWSDRVAQARAPSWTQPVTDEIAVGPGDDLRKLLQGLKEPATLRLAPGVYRLSQFVRPSVSLTLLGAGMAATRLHVVHGGSSAWVVLPQLSLTLRGLSFEYRGSKPGNLILGQGSVDAEACAFVGARSQPKGYQEAVNLQARGVLRDCLFARHGVAIRVRNHTKPTIERCAFQRCRSGGVLFEQRSRGAVSRCTFSSLGWGALVTDRAHPLILDSRFHGANVAAYLYQFAGGLVRGNHVAHAGRCAFEVEHDATPRIESNQVRDSHTAVSCAGRQRAWVRDNDVARGIYGLVAKESSRPTFQGNQVRDCEKPGIFSGDRSQPDVANNTVRGCQVGVACTRNSKASVRDNLLEANRVHGLCLQDTTQATAVGNTVRNNLHNGALVLLDHPCERTRLEDNVFEGNGEGGIEVYGKAAARLARNVLRRNAKGGIILAHQSRAVLEDNVYEENRQGQLILRDQARPEIVRDPGPVSDERKRETP